MDILSPMYMSSIINDGVAVGDTQHIIYTSVKMVAVAIIGVIGRRGQYVFFHQGWLWLREGIARGGVP